MRLPKQSEGINLRHGYPSADRVGITPSLPGWLKKAGGWASAAIGGYYVAKELLNDILSDRFCEDNYEGYEGANKKEQMQNCKDNY